MISTLYEPFRHWSEGGSVYILSDLHFADNDCKLMDPDWITPEEQLAIINETVHKNDTFVCLGDVGDLKYVPMIRARKKILILGNHDTRGACKPLFDEIYSGPLFISDKILLSHEPVYGLPWCLNIHGHDHNGAESYADGCKHINLAANVCGFTPVNIGNLIKAGILADIDSIHRVTIDRATERKRSKGKDGTAARASGVSPDMENSEIIKALVEYFEPGKFRDGGFNRFFNEHLDTYFDYRFLEDLKESAEWSVKSKIHSALEDYKFMNDPSHPVYLDDKKKELHFGEYVVPAYWFKGKMEKRENEDILLRYKRIWEKLGYDEIRYPLMQDWHDLAAWRQHYSEDMISRMEKDLEAGTTNEAMSLYYQYSRRASLYELERKYPDKIKEILAIENRAETGETRTADLKILLWDDSECFVRVGTDQYGRYCSTTSLKRPGFPLFTDNDERLIQRIVFDDPGSSGQ